MTTRPRSETRRGGGHHRAPRFLQAFNSTKVHPLIRHWPTCGPRLGGLRARDVAWAWRSTWRALRWRTMPSAIKATEHRQHVGHDRSVSVQVKRTRGIRMTSDVAMTPSPSMSSAEREDQSDVNVGSLYHVPRPSWLLAVQPKVSRWHSQWLHDLRVYTRAKALSSPHHTHGPAVVDADGRNSLSTAVGVVG